jgi:hypothetical protein
MGATFFIILSAGVLSHVTRRANNQVPILRSLDGNYSWRFLIAKKSMA